MSYITDRYELEKSPNQSLAVVECGIQICHAGHTAPVMSYRTYSAHFILEGKGTYTVGGRTYTLGAGEGFMITPGVPNTYAADDKDPWKYVYASFCGADDDALVHSAGLDEENVTFKFSLDADTVHNIYAMHTAGKKNEAKGYDVTGYFLLVMSRLIKANRGNEERGVSAKGYIKQAVRYIEDHYAYAISVSDIAFHIGFDRTYLYRLFREHLGCSPSAYLMNYRLEKAAQMLEHQELPISEIGMSVGFHDTAHFYKAFGAKFGMPPKKYQLIHYGNSTKTEE